MKKKIALFLVLLLALGALSQTQASEAPTPAQTLLLYQQALEIGNPMQPMAYYTSDAIQMMKSRQPVPAMMANEAATLKACGEGKEYIEKSMAVVAFSGKPQCSPYFLRWEEGAWRLDLVTMMNVIRFDGANKWWIDPKIPNPYLFAFKK